MPSSGRNYRNGWVVALLAFLVGLLIGGGLIAIVQGGDDGQAPAASRTTVTVTEQATDKPAADPPTASPDPETPTATDTENEDDPSAHTLGDSVPIGDSYEVAVVAAEKNANATIESRQLVQQPPKGQYVLVDLRATYLGDDVGTPWIDLTIRFAGTDARQYADYECGAVVPRSGTSVPDLSHGGKVTFQVCFDVPPKAIDGGQVIVEDGFSFDDSSREFWAID